MSRPVFQKQLQKMLYIPNVKMTPGLLGSSNFKICIGEHLY